MSYDAPTKRSSSWYGWQTLLVDVPALTLLVIGSGQKSAPMVAAGAAAYFSGPPLIHGAHGRGGVAAGSFALRAASLVPTLLVASDCDDEPGLGPQECVIAWKLSGSLAILTTTFVDALALAHETRVAPTIMRTRRGATAGLFGRF